MTPKSEVNGKHKEPHGRKLKFNDNGVAVIDCMIPICDNQLVIYSNSHYSSRPVSCVHAVQDGKGHKYHVWHNPETKTYMVSSA